MTTQYARASYQEIIDLHTESHKISVVGIHTPASQTPARMLGGFWRQFRKFRYNGCSIALVPAAKLPADPAQVSYGSGENVIDPRDLMNPILFKGCHGDNLNDILNTLYTSTVGSDEVERQFGDSVDHNLFTRSAVGSDTLYEAMYYRALTDGTWGKASPQRGFRKSGLHPMMYMIGTTHQLGNHPGDSTGSVGMYVRNPDQTFGRFNDAGAPVVSGDMGPSGSQTQNVQVGRGPAVPTFNPETGVMNWGINGTNTGFFTPRLSRLGWMDTYNVMGPVTSTAIQETLTGDADGDAIKMQLGYNRRGNIQNLVPKLFMGMIMLPPAYKTEMHFRLILNHSFSFRTFMGASAEVSLYTANYQNMSATEPTKAEFDRSKNFEEVEDDEPYGEFD